MNSKWVQQPGYMNNVGCVKMYSSSCSFSFFIFTQKTHLLFQFSAQQFSYPFYLVFLSDRNQHFCIFPEKKKLDKVWFRATPMKKLEKVRWLMESLSSSNVKFLFYLSTINKQQTAVLNCMLMYNTFKLQHSLCQSCSTVCLVGVTFRYIYYIENSEFQVPELNFK